MNKKIGLSDIEITWLNKRSLVLISIFAQIAHKEENTVINLRSKDVLKQISNLVKKSNNKKLADLYISIKRQIKLSVVDASLNTETSEKVAKVTINQKQIRT